MTMDNKTKNSPTSLTLNQLLSEMWVDYCQMNPQAKKIYDTLVTEGEVIENDHIALRTFNHPKLGLKSLARTFESYGYKSKGEYFFKEKKLYAQHWEHPEAHQPKIFISELELEKMSPFVQEEVEKLIAQMDPSLTDSPRFSFSGRPWSLSYATYEKLAKESEYASWVAAYGFRPNHFTVFINRLKKFHDIRVLNEFLKTKGFKLNSSGGEVKGTPEELLEQSSTMAEYTDTKFTDGVYKVPACYYEFAKRYEMKSGQLYQGFIAQSADKIFESTNRN